MNACRSRFAFGILPAIFLFLMISGPLSGPAPASAASAAKGPEVSTVGSGPYLGPTPQEIAKAARLEGAPTTPFARKAARVATISSSGNYALSAGERAKLTDLEAFLRTLRLPFDVKLEAAQIPTDGIPALTSPEEAKRAMELTLESAAPTVPPGPVPPEVMTVSPLDHRGTALDGVTPGAVTSDEMTPEGTPPGGTVPRGMTPAEIAKSKGATNGTSPASDPRGAR